MKINEITKILAMPAAVRLAMLLCVAAASTSTGVVGSAAAKTVDPSAPPRFVTLTIEPRRIRVGETAELRWRVANADRVKLQRNSRRSFPASGSIRIKPARAGKRTYELHAVNDGHLWARKRITLLVVGKADRPRHGGAPDAAPVKIHSFTATPNRIRPRTPVNIEWRTVNAKRVFFGVIGGEKKPMAVRTSGFEKRNPSRTTKYHLIAVGFDGRKTEQSVTVRVAANTPKIGLFTASPTRVARGGSATFRWRTHGAKFVVLDGQRHPPQSRGVTLRFSRSRPVKLVAVGPDGQVSSKTLGIDVISARRPSIDLFKADSTTIVHRDRTRLRWKVRNATSVSLQEKGRRARIVGKRDSKAIRGNKVGMRHFRLTAKNGKARATKDVSIRVMSEKEASCEKC